MSDRVARGEMEDRGAAAIVAALPPEGLQTEFEVVADEREDIASVLRLWCDERKLDVILTTGGTGLGPRDVTPEATLDVVRMTIPGIEEALRARGLMSLATAMLSRGVAGARGKTLIVNLPGSPEGAREGTSVLAPVLEHAVALLHGHTRHP